MPGKLILSSPTRRRAWPDRYALFLKPGAGLMHFRDWQYDTPLVVADRRAYGVGNRLGERIDRWVKVWTDLADGLSQYQSPTMCRELDIQRFNREAVAICRELALHLPDWQEICYTGLKRTGARFRSELLCTGLLFQGGAAAYYGNDRDPDRWVRVMGDYCSSGLWEWSGSPMDPADLPVPADLKLRLKVWAASFLSTSDSWYDGLADNFARTERHDRQIAANAVEGLAIARAIKAHLPDWTVVYHDTNLACRTNDRAVFQYEVLQHA